MKQTNSAIKFLLAQYRAIFKHAQLASVLAIIAAATASSPALAAKALDNSVLIPAFTTQTVEVGGGSDPYNKLTVSGGVVKDGQDDSFSFDNEITINLKGAGNAFTSSTADETGVVNMAKTTININGNGAALTIGEAGSGTAVTLSKLTLGKGTLTLTKGSVSANNIEIGGHENAADDDSVVSLAADTVLGSADGSNLLKKGAKVSVTGSATISGKTTMSGGVVEASGASNALTFDNTLIVGADAAVYTKDSGAITLAKGGTFASGTVSNAGALTLAGDTTFDSGAFVAATGTIEIGNTNSTVVAHMNADTLKTVIAGGGVKSVTNTKAVIELSDSADTAVDLGTSTIIDSANNKINAKLAKQGTGSLTIKGKKATYTAGAAVSGDATAAALEFDDLTLGSGDFALGANAVVTVNNQLTVNKGDNVLTLSGGALNLAGTAPADATKFQTVAAKGITLTNSGKLNVNSGRWTVKDLTLTKGTATVDNGSTLAITGALATTDASSILNVKNASHVDASAATKLTLKAGASSAQTVKVAGGSTLVLDQAKVFTVSGDTVTLTNGSTTDKSAVDLKSISTDATSVLEFKTGESFSLTQTQLDKVLEALGGADSAQNPLKGFISFGDDFKLEGFTDTTISVGDAASADVYGGITATTEDGNINKSLMLGNIKVTKGDENTKVAIQNGNSVVLYKAADGNFVANTAGTADVSVGNGASLNLAGTGKAGAIDGAAANQGDVIFGHDKSQANDTVTVESIGSTTSVACVDVVKGNVVLTDKSTADKTVKLQTQEMNLAAGTSLSAQNQDIVITSVSGTGSDLFGDVSANALTFTGSTSGTNTGVLTIAGEATVDVNKLTLGSDTTTLFVGIDGTEGSSGTLEVGTLDLAGGSLIVDPDFDHKAAVAAVAKLSKTEKAQDGTDAQVLNGNIAVGTNSAVGIGFETRQDVVDLLQSYGYMTAGEKMVEGTLDAALVVNTPIKVAKDNGIIVDGSKTGTKLSAELTSAKNALNLGAKSALVVNSDTYGLNPDGSKNGVAITFEGDTTTSSKGSVSGDATSQVILAGDFDASDAGVKVFDNATISGPAAGLTVVSANGILKGSIDSASGAVKDLAVADATKLKTMFAQASAPVQALLQDKISNTVPGKYDRSQLGTQFIGAVANDTDTSGVKADAAAHAATYAGAQQAAVAAVGTMADAIGGRVGSMAVEASVVQATGSQANGGVWLAPMYKSVDADGFAAQGASYGADVDLGGVAFGVDTVNGDMRFGAVFNIGSGDADGKGNGNGLKDEFDYYGFGMYAAMGFGNFALVGDASLNVISHDVEGASGLEKFGKLKASADTTAVTMGLTGQYTISNPMVDVTPHIGARFIRLDTDSYDLISEKGAIATTDFEVQNVFSVPLGVTLSKAFEMGGWSLAPSADLSVTFNTGDTEVDSTTVFSGVPSLALNTEVLDEVTYGVAVGLGAQYGAFGTQIGLNYTGSENTDSFGVNAQARYMF